VTSLPSPDASLLTSDPSPLRAELPGGSMTYVDEGPKNAPALVLVHGVPGSLRDFRYLAPRLSDRVRVIRLDLPGFGGSAPIGEALRTLRGRVRAVMALADHLDLDRFALLGHSMGGGTALPAAAAGGERISLLVLVASIGLRPHRGLGMSPTTLALLALGLRTPLFRSALLGVARRGFKRRRFPGSDQMDARAFAVHFRAFSAVDFSLMRRAARAPLPPTLVAYAEDDILVEPEIAAELLREIPHARGLLFPLAGHNLQKTRALELADAIGQALGV